MANKNAIIVGVVVVIVAVAAVAVYALNNNDKNETPTIGVGDSLTYIVFGTYGDEGELLDGTTTYKVLDETETQYKYQIEMSVNVVDANGKQTPLYIGSKTEWSDKTSDDSDNLIPKGTTTVSTFWGEKTLTCYESKDGKTHALADGDIPYAYMHEEDDQTMYLELSECTAIKDKKVDRVVHKAEIDMEMKMKIEGYTMIGTLTYGIDNKKTEIFSRITTNFEVAIQELPDYNPSSNSTTAWTDPFDSDSDDTGMVKTGTDRISTKWGTKETDVYKKVEDGETLVMYSYKNIPVRMTIEEDSLSMTFNAVSIKVDGKEYSLDEATEL